MPTTAAQTITEAYFLSGIVGAGFQSVNGDDRAGTGLRLLNGIIAEKSMDKVFLPYDEHTTINLVPGQEKYFVPTLVFLNALTFNQGNVRYPLVRDNVMRYFATGRVDNIQSLPVHFFAERALRGMNLYFYFVPSQAFVLNIDGRFSYDPVLYNEDMELQFDNFQIVYLQYKLASRLCDRFSFPMPENAKEQLDNLERRFVDLSGTDLTITKTGFSPGSSAPNYAWGVLFKGFVPGG